MFRIPLQLYRKDNVIMLKKFANKFWFGDDERKFQIADNQEISFQLNYKDIKIGTLLFVEDFWQFEYSDEFKSQNIIIPLVNFPQKDKIYRSTALWPFFASRIPSNAQLMATKKDQDNDLVRMLKEYGGRSVTNPFELQAAF